MADLPMIPQCGPAFYELMRNRYPGWILGVVQSDHVRGVMHALDLLGSESAEAGAAGCGLGWWTAARQPFDADFLTRFAAFNAARPFLPETGRRFFETLSSRLGDLPEEDRELWQAVMQEGDTKYAIKFLMPRLATPMGLSWLGHCWDGLLRFGSVSLIEAALAGLALDEALAPLMPRLRAEAAFHYESFESALKAVDTVDPGVWGFWPAYHRAELLIRAGETDEGSALLAELVERMPWHPNLALKLDALRNPLPLASAPEQGDVAILAYSWNKADLLADTLESLRQSDIGSARIFLLDNGSTDHMQDVFSRAGEWFGDRLHRVTLPVNIGAPPARNWLLSLPEVRACRWAAFLDDDVILPGDWLRRLLGAAGMKADAGVVGCRITASTPPYGLQSADYNLLPIPPDPGGPGEFPRRINIFDSCAGALDDGLFTYNRPCLSVSGCCHMVSLKAVKKAGDFDVRFNPSQFDDLERDLRSALHGMPAVYCGSLAIRHVQHSSLAKASTPQQMGHIMGNKYKLETKYEDAQAVKLAEVDMELLWRSFDDTLRRLDIRANGS
ncbi:glycosyltransferase [Salidesulfovibrio brasiliensis]